MIRHRQVYSKQGELETELCWYDTAKDYYEWMNAVQRGQKMGKNGIALDERNLMLERQSKESDLWAHLMNDTNQFSHINNIAKDK